MYQIKYETKIVAFLDVLGFKRIVINDDNSILERYYTIIKNQLQNLQNTEGKIESFIVSDSIILITETDISNFTSLLILIAKIQAVLGTQNIWLRGGISIGKIHFDKNSALIVGDGLINAYLLEEKLAIFPRVLIDTKIINHYNTSKEGMKNELNCKFNRPKEFENIFLDYIPLLAYNELYEDGHLYVTYTDYLICRILNWDNLNSGLLIDSKNFLKGFKTMMYSNSEYYPKYQWICSKLKVSKSDIKFFLHTKPLIDEQKVKQFENLAKEIELL